VVLVLNGNPQANTFSLQWSQKTLQYTLPPSSVATFIWK